MPKLSKEQQQAVAQWAAEGAGLNEIQDRLKREHELTLTYLDARLLVMELGLRLQDKKPQPQPEELEPQPPSAQKGDEEAAAIEDEESQEGWPEQAPGTTEVVPSGQHAAAAKVSVQVDQIAIPGAMVSGKVTFSDGKQAAWFLDQFGRLNLKPPQPGYQPPAADIPAFQRELDMALQRAGY